MKQPLKQVNFYKRALTAGRAQGFVPDRELCLHLQGDQGGAYFISFDTGEAEGTYHRLVADGDFSGVKLELVAATSADNTAPGIDDLAAYLAGDASAAEKLAVLTALPHQRAVDQPDILLHQLQGRWVHLCLCATPRDSSACTLQGLRLEFPRYSFNRYFPEIYQDNDFFTRYLAVFQSLYLDLEHRVDDVPLQLDYESAQGDQLAALASWLGIDTAGGIFGPEALRSLIRNSRLYQGGKGTRAALESVVELACGVRPRIVEYFQWNSKPLTTAQRRLYETLYGEDPDTFCVILDLIGRKQPLPVSEAQLNGLIDAYSMLGVRHKLVFLHSCSYTDTHCYLGVNSCLSTPETASVDGVRLGGYFTVG